MMITIDAARSQGKLDNFWNHIHFHPTEAVEDSWGRAILDRIAADRVAQFVRLHTMFEDIVGRGADGKLTFDFSQSDRRLDYMAERGFRLLLCFDFMPPCLAENQRSVSKLRYKNKVINRSRPTDYREWQEVCRRYTAHLVERYGKDTVANWKFHCWNEPDASYWVSEKGNDQWDADGDTDKIDEYIKLYDHFEAAVSETSPRTPVGGPSCAGSDRFIRLFLNHLKSGKNTVTGKTGTRIDFVGVHCYSQGVYSNLPNRFFVSPDNIMQRLRTARRIIDEAGFETTEMLLDEWGISGGGFLGIDRIPRHVFRETEYYPAFFARLIDRILAAPELKLSQMMICLSGQDHSLVDFDGYRTFFTANGFRKPIYNGYLLAAKLEGERVDFQVEAPSPHVGVIPARGEDGVLRVLLYHFDDDDCNGSAPNVEVELAIRNLYGRYRLSHSRIDSENGNAFTCWSKLGRPQPPSMWDRERISRAGETIQYLADEELEFNGEYRGRVVMTRNSVSLLEFTSR